MKVVIILLLAGIVLSFRLGLYWLLYHPVQPGQTLDITYQLLNEPTTSYNNQLIHYENITIDVPIMIPLHYGDLVRITGLVTTKNAIDQYGKRITLLLVKKPQVALLEANPVLHVFSGMRAHIRDSFNHTLNPNAAGLLLGIVFGIKDGINATAYDQFRQTGVLHVVAASGANVSILASIVLVIVSIFMRRKSAFIVTAMVILAYTVFAGFQASLIRAALMAIVAFAGGYIGRQRFAIGGLIISAYIMLLISPSLLQDVGFQLSFGATFGILTVKPLLDNILSPYIPSSFASDATTTLAAQLGTLPILVEAFGTVSLISIVANFAVLWVVPLLMVIGALAAIASYIAPFFTVMLLYLAYPLLEYFLVIIHWFSQISPMIHVGSLPFVIVIAYYCFLVAVILKYTKPLS